MISINTIFEYTFLPNSLKTWKNHHICTEPISGPEISFTLVSPGNELILE